MGGGSKTTETTVQNQYDPEASRRLAGVAERQQDLAEKSYNYYLDVFKPYETEMVDANRGLIQPYQEATLANLNAQRDLIPAQAALQRQAIDQTSREMALSAPVAEKFYQGATDGVQADYEGRVGQALGDVSQQFAGADAAVRREAARLGLNPNSGRVLGAISGNSMARAKASAAAATSAREGERRRIEDTSWQRVTQGMQARGGAAPQLASQTGAVNSGQLGGYGLQNQEQIAQGFFGNATQGYGALAGKVQGTQATTTQPGKSMLSGAASGALSGGMAGGAIGGPWGAAIGAVGGAVLGAAKTQ